MKILFLLTECPTQLFAGVTIAAHNHVKELAKSHDVHMVCPASDAHPTIIPAEKVHNIDFKASSGLLTLLMYACSWIPLVNDIIDLYFFRKTRKEVYSLVELHNFDVIVGYNISSFKFCPPELYKKFIINLEDPPSIRSRKLAMLPVTETIIKYKYYLSSKIIKKYELFICSKVALVQLLSATDVTEMQSDTGYKNISYSPYGISQNDKFEVVPQESRNRDIVYSGHMSHSPNVDGALYFINEVFPKILKVKPSSKLYIVGRNPNQLIIDASKKYEGNIIITGFVEDVSIYIKSALVCICPVRLRIGVQTKVLESMSYGTPVVTTSAGNSGILAEHGKEIYIADTSSLFSDYVIDLLVGNNWNAISKNGKKLVDTKYNWENSAKKIEADLNFVLSKSMDY